MLAGLQLGAADDLDDDAMDASVARLRLPSMLQAMLIA